MTSNLSIRAGAYRHRITIEESTVTQNEYGEEVEAWSTFARVWARVQPVSSREYLEARAQSADISHRIEMRYLEGVTREMRVRFKGRVFEIIQPPRNLEEVGKKMEMLCREIV